MEGQSTIDPVSQNLRWAIEELNEFSSAENTDTARFGEYLKCALEVFETLWRDARPAQGSLKLRKWETIIIGLNREINGLKSIALRGREEDPDFTQIVSFLQSAEVSLCFSLVPEISRARPQYVQYSQYAAVRCQHAKLLSGQASQATAVVEKLSQNTRAALLLIKAWRGAHIEAKASLSSTIEELRRLTIVSKDASFLKIFAKVENCTEHPLFAEIWDLYSTSIKGLPRRHIESVADFISLGFRDYTNDVLGLRRFIQVVKKVVESGNPSELSPFERLKELWISSRRDCSLQPLPVSCVLSDRFFRDPCMGLLKAGFSYPSSMEAGTDVALALGNLRSDLLNVVVDKLVVVDKFAVANMAVHHNPSRHSWTFTIFNRGRLYLRGLLSERWSLIEDPMTNDLHFDLDAMTAEIVTLLSEYWECEGSSSPLVDEVTRRFIAHAKRFDFQTVKLLTAWFGDGCNSKYYTRVVPWIELTPEGARALLFSLGYLKESEH